MDKQNIEHLIRSLGIGATYHGYYYLKYGIELCLENEDYLLFVSRSLYPEIAKHFNTNCSNIERALRTVINVCWERGNRHLLQEIALYPLTMRPAPGVFLDILTAYLRRESSNHS